MADMNDLGFDASKVDPNAGFDVMPAGDYEAVIVNSEIKTTSKGDGKYLKLELQILNGKYQNRKLWDQLNLWNPSAKAVAIAKGQLSSLCRAISVLTPKDSTQLHNKPFKVSVKIEKDQQYGDKNVIAGYKSRTAGPAAPPQSNGAPVGANASAGEPVTAGSPAKNPWG